MRVTYVVIFEVIFVPELQATRQLTHSEETEQTFLSLRGKKKIITSLEKPQS